MSATDPDGGGGRSAPTATSTRRRRATIGLLGLTVPLLAWNLAYLVAPSTLVGVLFVLGAGPGIGLATATLLGQTDDAAEAVFFTVVNALVVVSVLGGLVYVVPSLPLTGATLVPAFDATYVVALLGCWRYTRADLARLGGGEWLDGRRSAALLWIVVVGTGLVAFRLRASIGATLPMAMVYVWLLASFVALFRSRSVSTSTRVGFLAAAGVLITLAQAASTNGLFAIDGISTARIARSLVYGVETDIATERLFWNLSAVGTFPAMAVLSNLEVGVIAKYVVSAVAGLSLVGIYLLARTWLDRRWAFAAGFLLCYHYPFYAELTTLYRSALAFPVLVAFYVAITGDQRLRTRAAGLVYLVAVPLFHDTVGLFVLVVLPLAVCTAMVRAVLPQRRFDLRSIETLFLHTGVLGVTFYLVYSRSPSFDVVAAKTSDLLSTITSGASSGSSRRTVTSTVGALNDNIVDVFERLIIVVEVGIMAVMAGLVVFGWLHRGRLRSLLPRVGGREVYEALLVANVAVFGLLVLHPVLGVPRVFLYASPMLMVLFTGAVWYIGELVTGVSALRQRAIPGSLPEVIATSVMILLVVIGFGVQTGLVGYAAGYEDTKPALENPDRLRLLYYQESDVAGNQWATEHVTDDDRLFGDQFVVPLLTDDPELRHSTIGRITTKHSLANLTDRGCVFLRAINVDTGQLLVWEGPRTSTVQAFPREWLTDGTVAYSAGSTRIVC